MQLTVYSIDYHAAPFPSKTTWTACLGKNMMWAQAEALVSAGSISSSQQSHASWRVRSARCCSAETHFLANVKPGWARISRGGGGRMQVPTLSQIVETRLAVRTGEQRCGARLGAETHFRAALLGHPARAGAVAVAADVPRHVVPQRLLPVEVADWRRAAGWHTLSAKLVQKPASRPTCTVQLAGAIAACAIVAHFTSCSTAQAHTHWAGLHVRAAGV